jgi:flagellar basal body-associated protein FliL
MLILFPLVLVAIGVVFSFFVKFKKTPPSDENGKENEENLVSEISDTPENVEL